MKSKKKSKLTSVFLLMILSLIVVLLGCNNVNNINSEVDLVRDYEAHIKTLTSEITELKEKNESLSSENELYKNQIQEHEIVIIKLTDQLEARDGNFNKYKSYIEFEDALDDADVSLEELINFYYYEIGDGAYGQQYALRVLDYFYEMELDEFLKNVRNLNDRYIDNLAYNLFEGLLFEHSMSDDYTVKRNRIETILSEKLKDSSITNEDRQLIHALLSHFYRTE